MSFRPGDIVRCINPGPVENCLVLDKQYTVQEVRPFGMVRFQEYIRPGVDDTTPAEFFEYRFALVTRNMNNYEG